MGECQKLPPFLLVLPKGNLNKGYEINSLCCINLGRGMLIKHMYKPIRFVLPLTNDNSGI